MLLILSLACAPVPEGTWMFSLNVTASTGDECASTVSSNFTGAVESESPPEEESDYTTDSSQALSPRVFFGRIESTEDGGAVLIVGTEALPGTVADDGAWTFAWVGTDETHDTAAHPSGYAYDHTHTATSVLKLGGMFTAGALEGTYALETEATEKWSESDTWSDEAAAYVSTTGKIPASTYVSLDDGTGNLVPASNTQTAYDCDQAGCALTVSAACAYRYDLTGVLTDFEPDDARWVEDAGQTEGP